MEFLSNYKIVPTESNNKKLIKVGTTPLRKPASLKELLRRTEIFYDDLSKFSKQSLEQEDRTLKSLIENEVKYEGYIERQNQSIEQISKLKETKIPDELNIDLIPGLSNELKQKLNKIQPETIGQASRISGITPAALSILMIYIKKEKASASLASKNL